MFLSYSYSTLNEYYILFSTLFYSKFCKPWIILEQNSKRVLTSLAARIVYASNCFTWSSRTRVVGWIGKCWATGCCPQQDPIPTQDQGPERSWLQPTCHAVPKCWQDNNTGPRIHYFYLRGIIKKIHMLNKIYRKKKSIHLYMKYFLTELLNIKFTHV